MAKEAIMTVRLEADLHAAFMRAAARAHRPAAQIVRDFMREHVQRENATESLSRLDETERRQREEAVNYARASVQLEGFEVPEAYSKEAERFIRGEMDFSALTAKVHELAGQ